MDVDSAYENFKELEKEIAGMPEPVTEADIRFQIIDRLLRDILGWDTKDFSLEPSLESGYADYVLKDNGTNRLVIEAKRSSSKILDSKNNSMGFYKASGPVLKAAKDGMTQAQSYCSNTGVTFSALTNGHQWVGFWAIRDHGVPPFDGKAVVFPNFSSISNDFVTFYNLFSKEGIRNQLFKAYISEHEGLRVISSEKLEAPTLQSGIRLMHRQKLASDIELIFKRFFSDISGDNDPDMLAECFVESKESKEAEVGLEKIARNLLQKIELVDSGNADELRNKIETSIDLSSSDFVLIVGGKGSGKSTFIDRFFRIIIGPSLKKKCLFVKLDLRNSDGDEGRLQEWLSKNLVNTLETQLFGKKIPKYEDLEGIFFDEYNRWKHGELQHLYKSDKEAFKIKFGEHIIKQREKDPHSYAIKLINTAANSHKKMPCIIFDNTDHFSNSFQEKVFQYAQSINKNSPSFIICPITDKTVWQLSKSGPLQSFDSHAFYLPVPQSKEILRKRVSYLHKKVKAISEGEKKILTTTTLTKGIKLTIPDLTAFVTCIEKIFIDTDYVSRMVSWLSNHDIRRGLRIAERIITSPHISIESLIRTWANGKELTIREMNIRKALLYGSYTLFNQEHSEYILNIFLISPRNITSPLLKPSILRLLIDIQGSATNGEEEYFSITNIFSYFDSCGVSSSITSEHLSDLIKYRLIEPYDPTDDSIYDTQRVRITHSGHIHYEFLTGGYIYVPNMALVTPIRDFDTVSTLRRLRLRSDERNSNTWPDIRKEFVTYLLEEDRKFISIPNMDQYKSQHMFRSEISRKWVTNTGYNSYPKKKKVNNYYKANRY
ncbi:hypothetical protein O5O45_14245 [Hahella aquimaris]|uniref:hypothetical protein n=1 Tax=Hahella sp. HNIBRBA332 TaxID=3015983 RepID=UPI00273CE145|nr:hypothetical protein [Hahella sp. HNIBRBA332]WLQ17077.1 hypothetical protein O5O45_14245 [Hahella sp. HNIBRBA332]